MNQRTLSQLLACAVLGASVCGVYAQPAAPAAGQAPAVGQAPGGAPGAAGARAGQAPGRGGMSGFGRMQQIPVGPPAAVPPEVAIPRPSSEELVKINADLKKFIETSADKDLLKKFESLLVVQMPRDTSAIRPAADMNISNRNARFIEQMNSNEFDVIFFGDSITELLGADADPQGNPGGKKVMEKYLSGVKFLNQGISGDSTQGVLWRLKNGVGQLAKKPKVIVLMIGTNNNGNNAEEIAEGIGAVILEMRTDFPDAKIILNGIFPRGATTTDSNRRKVAQVNSIIAKLDDQKHVFFTDLTSKMVDAQGALIGFRKSDNLHPVEEGFDIWISSVTPIIKGWLK